MKTDLVRIGNSRGIRIPKPLIEQCGLGETVDLRVESNRIIITPRLRPRQDWADCFRSAPPNSGDELLLEPIESNVFDREEWRW